MYRYASLFLVMTTLDGIVLQATKDNIGKGEEEEEMRRYYFS